LELPDEHMVTLLRTLAKKGKDVGRQNRCSGRKKSLDIMHDVNVQSTTHK